jgi:Dyp-type peroxidase family
MAVLDYADIQGNILSPYGKLGFPKARFITLHVDDPVGGRDFVTAILPMITTALRWPTARSSVPTGKFEVSRPDVAINIAFSWNGLLRLGIPTRTLRGMPDEFIDGMMGRASMLGDDFTGSPRASWDRVWAANTGPRNAGSDAVDILITLNAQMKDDGSPVDALGVVTDRIEALCRPTGGVRVIGGHDRAGSARYQELSAITASVPDGKGKVEASPVEHFGFTDAIGDPVFEGQYPERYEEQWAKGCGAVDGAGKWRPLATGEFLLGYPDEAQEIAGAAMPLAFSRNGTFMAYRKLHQNVVAFRTFMAEAAARFGEAFGINSGRALDVLKAKMIGRWTDGVPLTLAPTVAQWDSFNKAYPITSPETYQARLKAISDFAYRDDLQGIKCPMTSHMRRVHPRDGMGPTGTGGSVLTNRRRVLRRGLPYGNSSNATNDDGEHGVIMLVVCSSLFRQFEFVQQQWINYGLDAHAGNDTCPLVGNHSTGGKAGPPAKFVVPSEPGSGRPPYIVEGLPQFVETRGGEYFFVPSMTALRMIGMGVVDPT